MAICAMKKPPFHFHKFALAYPDFTYSLSALYCYSEPSLIYRPPGGFPGIAMTLEFRQVREDEVDTYQALMHAAYAPTLALGIKFDAASYARRRFRSVPLSAIRG